MFPNVKIGLLHYINVTGKSTGCSVLEGQMPF